MDLIAHRIAVQYPGTNQGWGVAMESLRDAIVGNELRQSLLVLFGAVGFLLLIACANVANLTLARHATRQREVAIRATLGAGRLRLTRQLLTESLLLVLFGGAAGVILAYSLVGALVALIPPFNFPTDLHVGINHRVLFFTLGISLLTGIIFGGIPAWKTSKSNLNSSLKDANFGKGLSRHHFRSLLVVSEITLALVLLIGAGLLIHSFQRMLDVDPGLKLDNVLTMLVTLPESKYSAPQQFTTFFHQALQRIESLPGVKRAALVTMVPLRGWGFAVPFAVQGQSAQAFSEQPSAHFQRIAPGFFRALTIPLLKGRGFTEHDTREAPPVAVVNQTLVRQFFPNQDPIGKRLSIDTLAAGSQDPGSLAWEIVGVVGNVKFAGLAEGDNPEIYVPYDQSPLPFTSVVVRTGLNPITMAHSVKNAIREVDKDQPVTYVLTMEQIRSESVAQPRFRTLLLGLFAAIALVLATVGVYGVISYSVTERTREIGIRAAMGARPADLVRLVITQGAALTLVGIVIGLAAALALSRVLSSLLFGLTATDPATYAALSALLALVALLACYIPARRAAKADPMVALRYE